MSMEWYRATGSACNNSLPDKASHWVTGDEMMCSKIPFSNYSAVAGAVRQWLNAASLKDTLIYSNECSQPLVRGGEVWSIPAKLPVELDLFS